MFFELIILSIVLISFLAYPYFYGESGETSTAQIQNKLSELKKFVSIIVNHIQLERAFQMQKPFLLPRYELFASETSTRTHMLVDGGREIHIVVWDKSNHKLYDDNTLRYAVLHEIAHVMAPGNKSHGSPEFEAIESALLSSATKMGYYNPKTPLPDSYPCI